MKKIACAFVFALLVSACATGPNANPNILGGSTTYSAFFDGYNKSADERVTREVVADRDDVAGAGASGDRDRMPRR